MKKISRTSIDVLILNHNKREDLRVVLDGVKKQTIKPKNIIVVDNNSSDGSVEMVESEYPEVKVIKLNRNFGCCAGYNRGFEEVESDLVAVLDNDVVIERDYLEIAVKKFAEVSDNVGIISSHTIERGAEKHGRKTEYWDSFNGAGWVARKEVIKRTSFDERFFVYVNERDLGAKVLNRGYKILYYPKLKLLHKKDAFRKETKEQFYYMTRNRYWLIFKYYPLKDAIYHFFRFSTKRFIKSVNERKFFQFWGGFFSALMGLKYCIENREPCKDINKYNY